VPLITFETHQVFLARVFYTRDAIDANTNKLVTKMLTRIKKPDSTRKISTLSPTPKEQGAMGGVMGNACSALEGVYERLGCQEGGAPACIAIPAVMEMLGCDIPGEPGCTVDSDCDGYNSAYPSTNELCNPSTGLCETVSCVQPSTQATPGPVPTETACLEPSDCMVVPGTTAACNSTTHCCYYPPSEQ